MDAADASAIGVRHCKIRCPCGLSLDVAAEREGLLALAADTGPQVMKHPSSLAEGSREHHPDDRAAGRKAEAGRLSRPDLGLALLQHADVVALLDR